MSKITKVLFKLFIALFVAWGVIVLNGLLNGPITYYDLGDDYEIEHYYKNRGCYFKKDNINDSLAHIVNWEYDDNHIILARYPEDDYNCIDNTFFSDHTHLALLNIEYIIVDKSKDIIYATFDKDKFLKKRNELGVKIYFDKTKPLIKKYVDEKVNKWKTLDSLSFTIFKYSCKRVSNPNGFNIVYY